MVTVLTPEEYELVDETITEIIHPAAVGTIVLKPYTVKSSVMELSWDKYKGRGNASLDMSLGNENFDNLTLDARTTVPAPLAHAEFTLDWRMLEAAREGGRNIETANVAEAAAVTLTLAETTIFSGNTGFNITGITNTSGIKTVSGADFSTAGNAYETFRKARDEMITNNINPPYVAFLNPAQYGEIDILIANTGISQRGLIEGNFVDKVYWSSNITATEGFVIGNSRQYMDRATLGGVEKDIWKQYADKATSDVLGQTYMLEIPRIRQASAIVKMTSI